MHVLVNNDHMWNNGCLNADNFCKQIEPDMRFKKSEYDQEIPQSHTAGQSTATQHKTSGRQLSNQLSLPHQGDCKTRMDTYIL